MGRYGRASIVIVVVVVVVAGVCEGTLGSVSTAAADTAVIDIADTTTADVEVGAKAEAEAEAKGSTRATVCLY